MLSSGQVFLKGIIETGADGNNYLTFRIPVNNESNAPAAPTYNNTPLIPRLTFMKDMNIAGSTFIRWYKAGKIKITKVGSKIFVRRSSFE